MIIITIIIFTSCTTVRYCFTNYCPPKSCLEKISFSDFTANCSANFNKSYYKFFVNKTVSIYLSIYR